MTTPPDWLLDAYEASDIPEFAAFARQARLAAQAPGAERSAPTGAGAGADATARVGAGGLTPERLQELEAQYRVSHSTGVVRVTWLSSQDGDKVQAMRPPWPQHLMINGAGDGSAGLAYIEIQYMLPELTGEDLSRCARDCREAVLSVLPVEWRDAAVIEVERRVSWEHLNLTCSHHLEAFPGEEECLALLREVAVRCADLNLMGVLAAALSGQEEVQAQLAAEVDEEEEFGDGVPAETITAEPGTAQMREFYRAYPDQNSGGHWTDLIGLNAEHAGMMQVMPISLKLEPAGREATMLTAQLGFDELEHPAVQERIRALQQNDPVRTLVGAFSREHLAPLGLAGTLHIDISLEDTYLNLHFVSPGVPAREGTFDRLFAVAAAFWHQRLLSDVQEALRKEIEDGSVPEEADEDQHDDDVNPFQALQSILLRAVYQRELEETPDGSWKAYIALKPESAHLMEQLPVGLLLQPSRDYTVLMLALRMDELENPAVKQRLNHLRPGDPVRALVEAFSREHLTSLGLAGTLHLDISLEDGLLKVHFVSPGTVAKEEALKNLFEVLDACQQRDLVTGIQELLQGEGDEDSEEGTLDSATILSAGFLKRAGFTLLGMRGDSFTEVAWNEPDGRGGMGLLWLEPTSTTPYPVLTFRTATLVPQSDAPDIVAAALQDHFMQFETPPSLVEHLTDNWMATRTLTPALYVHSQADGQTQVASIRSWPVAGPMTPALLQYMAGASFGQFQNLLQRAGFNVTPDYTPPRPTGRGEREWLTQGHLLQLVGDDRIWQPQGTNEIICMVRGSIENEREQPRGLLMFRKAKETREIRHTLYLRYVSMEENSVPGLYLRAHTEGSLGRNKESLLAQHHLKHLKPLLGGGLLPVTVDKDGDLTIRQIVLCPERPTPELVRHLVQVAERSLYFAAQQVVF
ncbi:hypothetical protein F8S09_13775 [Deinococcus sp. SDU3-2]|uniref:Uncharacterized protein n=1 Tax=Deinococcus terrestris TaxID=2651870 RepID=A0A7X1TSR4_9DEIO|nr:hypothetical protein [Deinococcus terrestris]MPY67736.1 hypothetical protein [Deinococcus terrestris]